MSDKRDDTNTEVGRLFVCSTPIGNLRDITLRALDVLSEVDLIAAEDTRVTRKLLSFHGISARCISYREENRVRAGEKIMKRLVSGARVALVSDAGTPGISDPGHHLIKSCIEQGISVEVVPGPSAAVSALVVSGLPTARFSCEGFLPRRRSHRRKEIERMKTEEGTVIFFESPHRVKETLQELDDILGDRPMALARELTKKYEEVIRGTAGEILSQVGDRVLKGEIVLVIGGAEPEKASEESIDEAVERARDLVKAGVTARDAAALIAKLSGLPRRPIYNRLVASKDES